MIYANGEDSNSINYSLIYVLNVGKSSERKNKRDFTSKFATNLFGGTGPNIIPSCVPVSSPKA